MTESAQRVLSEAMSLSEAERAEVVEKLLATLEPSDGAVADEGYEDAWKSELEERIRQLDSGEVKPIPWEQVRRELRGENTP